MLYAEISLFATRILVEAEAYEIAWFVAAFSAGILKDFVAVWKRRYNDKGDGDFKLSVYVTRYQLGTLYSWKAYCADYLERNMQARAKALFNLIHFDLQSIDHEIFKEKSREKWLEMLGRSSQTEQVSTQERRDLAKEFLKVAFDQIDNDIQKALLEVSGHPLTLWVKAQRAHHELQLEQASSELQHLIEILAPYDPDTLTATWRIVEKKWPGPQDESVQEVSQDGVVSKMRDKLQEYQIVRGNEQFAYVVNPYIIHEQLAKNFAETDRFNLSIQHLMLAVSHSHYLDVDGDRLLMQLVQYLDRQERLNMMHKQ